MNDSQVCTLADTEEFINAADHITFKTNDKKETYEWIENTLIKLNYLGLNKREKGKARKYIMKITGYSKSQITRLINQYRKTGHVIIKQYDRHKFSKVYSDDDIRLLAKTDKLHEYPNGCALKNTLRRMYVKFNDSNFESLAGISVSHIYNFRKNSTTYRNIAHYEKTKPVVSNIGERRKPEPDGKPGYLRVDSVHQGDRDNVKGIYHINVVDDVTQFEFIGAVEQLSYRYVEPMLEALIDLYPFIVIEFHSDNGSEFINQFVADMLNGILVKLTKSRARQTNDNALVESKNGSIVRKWVGYGFIDKRHVGALNRVYAYLNEYINYHRSCAFPTEIVDKKGKTRKIYMQGDYMTPYDKFKSLKNVAQYLKPGVKFENLDRIAYRYTDNQMADIVQNERDKFFKEIYQPVVL